MTHDIPDDVMRAADEAVREFHNSSIIAPDLRGIIARAIMAERAARGWQPIETAPKDGTPVLCVERDYEMIAAWHQRDGGGQTRPSGYWISKSCCDGWTSIDATHWMPPPAPPILKGEA